MEHLTTVKYKGGLDKLATDLGNLQYDALGDLLYKLHEKVKKDADTDANRGRAKLAKELKLASKHIRNAWGICVPYMGMTRKAYPEIQLEKKYKLIEGVFKSKVILAVDGEKYFAQPGISHGCVHFADPETKEFIGFSGVDWFKRNSILVS